MGIYGALATINNMIMRQFPDVENVAILVLAKENTTVCVADTATKFEAIPDFIGALNMYAELRREIEAVPDNSKLH